MRNVYITVLILALASFSACSDKPAQVSPPAPEVKNEAVSQPSLAKIKGFCQVEYENLRKPDVSPGMLKKTTVAQRHAAAAAMSKREGLTPANAKVAEEIMDSLAQNE